MSGSSPESMCTLQSSHVVCPASLLQIFRKSFDCRCKDSRTVYRLQGVEKRAPECTIRHSEPAVFAVVRAVSRHANRI